jgi:hypothetical protein
VWIAISVYVLVAIVKKELQLDRSLYDVLQILSLTLFEKMPIFQALSRPIEPNCEPGSPNQLTLFDLYPDSSVIHSVVENQFSGVDFFMLGPFDVFARVFKTAGFVYIGPQQLGFDLMRANGVAASDYASSIAQYITEPRVVGDRLVNNCQAGGEHYVFLETDYEDGCLDEALRRNRGAGVLVVFRNDIPVAGSTVSVGYPAQKRTNLDLLDG